MRASLQLRSTGVSRGELTFSITKTSSSSSTTSTWPSWPRIQEDDFADAADDPSGYAPRDAADAVDNYRRVLEIIGEVAGEMIAPNAEQVDREGNTLNDDGTVTLHPLVQENLDRLTQADMMGFTLPRKYGGLNCPSLVYTMATEIDQPGRLLADEHVRAARHRRDDLRLRQRRDQGRGAAAVLPAAK